MRHVGPVAQQVAARLGLTGPGQATAAQYPPVAVPGVVRPPLLSHTFTLRPIGRERSFAHEQETAARHEEKRGGGVD